MQVNNHTFVIGLRSLAYPIHKFSRLEAQLVRGWKQV
jgi:ribosomal protein S6